MRFILKAVCPLASIVAFAAMMAFYIRHQATEVTDTRMLFGPIAEWYTAVTQEQDLEVQVNRVRQRSDAKYSVVADVIATRLTLFEAAARFRDLNASSPEAERWLSYQFRDQPYELALCRSIILRVDLELRLRTTGQKNDTIARLEAELTEHLQRHGRVCLPD